MIYYREKESYREKETGNRNIVYCSTEAHLKREEIEKKMGTRLEVVEKIPEDTEWLCYLFERNPENCRTGFAFSREPEIAELQAAQKEEGVFWLDRRSLRENADNAEKAKTVETGENAENGEAGKKVKKVKKGEMSEKGENPQNKSGGIGILAQNGAGDELGLEEKESQAEFQDYVKKGLVRAVNLAHPRWKDAAMWKPPEGKKRVHILAMGDVGSMLLTGLKLLGGDVIGSIGIWDINETAAEYWACEMNQALYPWDYQRMPEVEAINREQLFDCDVFLFCASRGVPPVGAAVSDVRMAQFDANAAIVKEYAKRARETGFRGLFGVVSDPVDPLCKAAYVESNRDEDGRFDGKGLFPEQIQGFGLGVMNARAAYFAKRDSRLGSFLQEGRAYGPHGEDLVIANSLENYDDALSQELTGLAVTANLKVREMGFKPYVAPALSSGALSVLLMLRGEWHYSSTFLGGVFMGAKNRFTPMGLETECVEIPKELFARIKRAERNLRAIEERGAENGNGRESGRD